MPIKAGWRDTSSRSRILAEAKSFAATSLQQRQSISLASFFKCPHLHQSRFPILICNNWHNKYKQHKTYDDELMSIA